MGLVTILDLLNCSHALVDLLCSILCCWKLCTCWMLTLMTVNSCSRTFMSIIGGVIAGVLGFTSLMGFVFYFLVMAITSVGLAAKAGFSVHSYFDSWNRIILDGFLGGLMVHFYTLQFLCYMCLVICFRISSNVQLNSELMRLTFCACNF